MSLKSPKQRSRQEAAQSPATWLLLIMLFPLAPASPQSPCSWADMGGALFPPFWARDLAVHNDGTGPELYAAVQGPGRWDGTTWQPMGAGLPGVTSALQGFDSGAGAELYAAAAHVARWDGTSWVPLGGTVWTNVAGGQGDVSELTVYDDGSGPALYAAGNFTVASGVPAHHIAKWDGTNWSPLGGGPPAMFTNVGFCHPMAVHDDGTGPALYLGTCGLSPLIMRWDGVNWTTMGGANSGDITAFATFDDGTGPGFYAGGNFQIPSVPGNINVARWDGTGWQPVGSGVLGTPFGASVNALQVFDDGTGPALYAGSGTQSLGGPIGNALMKWDGASWTNVATVATNPAFFPNWWEASIFDIEVFDSGSGPRLYVGGVFTHIGSTTSTTTPATNIAVWNCPGALSLSSTQPSGSGGPIYITNANLTSGNVYFNIYSLSPCPGPVGSGPFLGLCGSSPGAIQFLLHQTTLPLETPASHFVATNSWTTWGPFNLPPLTLDAITLDVTGGVLGSGSLVTRMVIQ